MKALTRCLLPLACAGALPAADTNFAIPTENGSNITIKLSSPLTGVPRFGFMPIKIAIENLSAREGTWRFRFNAGTPASFPGVAASTFELAVPSAQTRESWFFVPIAEPGISNNPAAAVMATSAATLSLGGPPTIDTVWPNSPQGVGRPTYTSSTSRGAGGGLVRTYTISQTGPATKLPNIPASKLPPNTTVSLTPPNAAGVVTRTTVVSVDSPLTPGTASSAFSSSLASPSALQASAAMANARAKLAAANLNPPSAGFIRTSLRSSTAAGGMTEFTVTLLQRGPAADLPLPDLKTLPPGFTSVSVNPADSAGDVLREFIYVERSIVPPPTSGPSSGSLSFSSTGGTIRPVTPGLSLSSGGLTFTSGTSGVPIQTAANAEAEARKALDPTGLLKVPAGVSMGPAQFRSMTATNASGGLSSNSGALVIFEQVGPAALLPLLVPAALPPAVRVAVHPSPTPGSVVRMITWADLNFERALATSVASTTSPRGIADSVNLARFELMRLGYLRSDSRIQQSQSQRSSSPGLIVPDIHVFMESGPPNLLPEPPAGSLPAGIAVKMTPGVLPGETTRNFIVDTAALAKAVTGSPVASASQPGGGSGRTPSVLMTPAMNLPTSLAIDAAGPGIAQGRVSFPTATSTPLPPMAVGANIDAALRAKLAAAMLRNPVNFAAVEPAQLPADWRVWSSFNSVVLAADTFAALPPAHRAALRGWVALGGVLVLSPSAAGEDKVENLGAGRIDVLTLPISDMVPRDLVSELKLAALSPGMPDRELLRFGAGTPMDDLARTGGADVVWLIVFLVAFALLIGPVNLFLLAPAGKRHRLFFTMPLLSLVGAVAVAGAIVFQDGFGGQGARRALVVLVPGENQAAVFQEQAVHTGFLMRRDFELEDHTLFAVLPTEDALLVSPNTPPQFNRDRGRASGDWFRNRARQAHLLRLLVPTRARVELVGVAPGGAPIVESTLATELRNFHLRDENDSYWTTPSLSPGKRVTLQLEMPKAAEAAARDFGGDGTPNFTTVLSAASLREAWNWRAEGGGTELAPLRTLASVRWKDHPVVYAGVAERSTPSQPRVSATEKGGQ